MITCATFSDAMSSDLARDHIGANTAFDSRLSADSIGGSGASAVTWTPCVCVNVHPCTPHTAAASSEDALLKCNIVAVQHIVKFRRVVQIDILVVHVRRVCGTLRSTSAYPLSRS